jgi:hypothetical protein
MLPATATSAFVIRDAIELMNFRDELRCDYSPIMILSMRRAGHLRRRLHRNE